LRERVGAAVTSLGWLEGEELARAYAAADIFLFASRTDTFGQVILEAQASGLPVVAVAAGGPLSLIEDRVSGLLRPPDASALAARRNPPPPTAAPEPPPETQAGASLGAGSPGGVKGRRILIVEDAVLLALELEAGLTEAGARVIGTAADVAEALKLSEQPFDVAVLDANLNGTPVTPVAEALRALGKPFIFATGYGDAAPVPEGFDAPVVRKPYNISQIAAAIAEAMAR